MHSSLRSPEAWTIEEPSRSRSPNVSFSRVRPWGKPINLKRSCQWSVENASPRIYLNNGTRFYGKGYHQNEISGCGLTWYWSISFCNFMVRPEGVAERRVSDQLRRKSSNWWVWPLVIIIIINIKRLIHVHVSCDYHVTILYLNDIQSCDVIWCNELVYSSYSDQVVSYCDMSSCSSWSCGNSGLGTSKSVASSLNERERRGWGRYYTGRDLLQTFCNFKQLIKLIPSLLKWL